jgi:predicted nucleic acid-binding Zn ribbon protein
MPRTAQDQFDRDDDDDEEDDSSALSDRDDPDPSDQDDDDEYGEHGESVPCPYCGKQIAEEAEVCPQCRNFISREDAPRRGKPWWVWLLVILCLVGLLLMAL